MAKENYEIEWQTISIRTIKIFIFLLLAGASFAFYWYYLRHKVDELPVEQVVSVERIAWFTDYEGKVEVKPRDKFEWIPASFKMDLREGDKIHTFSDSSARIKFEDGTEITVQSDSIVTLKPPAAGSKKEKMMMVVETGASDINAEKSQASSLVATEKIDKVQFLPGSITTVEAAPQRHSVTVRRGVVAVEDEGRRETLTDREQLIIDENNVATKIKLPSIPTLISPANGQVFDMLSDIISIELKWRDVPDAVRYHVQISEHPLFGKLSGENQSLEKSSITIHIQRSNKKQFFWRVRSIDRQNNRSPWSESNQFVVQPPGNQKLPSIAGPKKPPPKLEITYIHMFGPYVQVDGRTDPDVFLKLNDQIIDVREDGSFVFTYTLQKSGWNDLVFVAEDPQGQTTRVVKRVEYK